MKISAFQVYNVLEELIPLMCVCICVRSVRRVQREQFWMRPKTLTSLCLPWGTSSRPWPRERYSREMFPYLLGLMWIIAASRFSC